jgi:hypothetical protein|tara:strand:+ start:675 stop:848 length:174 start_codon:yes stop_codon:yes gene_type:complete
MIPVFIIVEIPDSEIEKCTDCLMHSFKYMVQDEENTNRWFGSNIKQECIDYIENYTA